VYGNIIASNGCGVKFESSSYNNMMKNRIYYNGNGVYLENSSYNNVVENNITYNANVGIEIGYSSSNNSIVKNIFVECGLNVYTGGNTVNDNLVNDKPLVYLERMSDYTVRDAGQVILVKCKNIIIEDLSLSYSTIGIELIESDNVKIRNNKISLCAFGMFAVCSFYIDISENNITKNNHGIRLEDVRHCTISGNNITKNDFGIYLSGARNNSIYRNNIINNTVGIDLPWYSFGNRIYHNNFINNSEQVIFDSSFENQNLWDNNYPNGGNYWGEYTRVDKNSGLNQDLPGSDSIVDTPYIINENNTDRYPLTAPFKSFEAGVWDGTAYNVDIVSNSTVSDFKFDSDNKSISLKVTGDNGTVGFCRVAIPKSLLWADDGWTIFVDNQLITDYTKFEDENNTYLYFTYTHSTKTVTIKGTHVIPEYPSTIILTIFMLTTTVLVALTRNKRLKYRYNN